jgi:hypothetical protein
MHGLLRFFCAWMLASLLGSEGGFAADVHRQGPLSDALAPESAIAPRADGSDVDAFLAYGGAPASRR